MHTPMLSYKKTMSITLLAVLMVAIACFAHVQAAWADPVAVTTPNQAVAIESARTAKVPAAIPVPIQTNDTGNGFLVPMSATPSTQSPNVSHEAVVTFQMGHDTWLAAITLLSVVALGCAFGGIVALRQWRRAQQVATISDES